MSTLKKPQIAPEVQAEIDRILRRLAAVELQLKSNKEIPKKDWYRPAEVCQMMGISRAKFEAHKRSGFFQIHKIPGAGGVYIAATELTKLFPKVK